MGTADIVGDPESNHHTMGRIERKAFRLKDQIVALRQDERRLAAELDSHRDIHDDAQRDAIAGNADDRVFYGEVKGDLARFERALAKMRDRIATKEAHLARLLSTFGD